MKRKTSNIISLFALIAVSFGMLVAPASAQHGNSNPKTDSRILYHNGPVMQGTSNVYLIWYGNWGGNTATRILTELVINLGSYPYFQINTLYPDALGNAPNGGLFYAGTVEDAYSRGTTLTVSDIHRVIREKIEAGILPLDGAGIYIVIASADVTDIRPNGTSFCFPLFSFPHHGTFDFNGAIVKYGFLGNAERCPTSAAPQFIAPDGTRLPTPNDNFGADAMASSLAHLLNVIVTSPTCGFI